MGEFAGVPGGRLGRGRRGREGVAGDQGPRYPPDFAPRFEDPTGVMCVRGRGKSNVVGSIWEKIRLIFLAGAGEMWLWSFWDLVGHPFGIWSGPFWNLVGVFWTLVGALLWTLVGPFLGIWAGTFWILVGAPFSNLVGVPFSSFGAAPNWLSCQCWGA